MPNILAIDSSTEACSVALQIEGQIISRYQLAPRRHAELLLPMVDSVLKEGEIELDCLDAIACCVGPGAFTGLRIAISVAQGLAYAVKLPCIAISSLQIMAAEAFAGGDFRYCLASIDARMQEVYFSVYERGENNLPIEKHPQQVIAAESIQLATPLFESMCSKSNESSQFGTGVIKVGNGWAEYPCCSQINDLSTKSVQIKYPDAVQMFAIANANYQLRQLLKPEFLQPIYLRNNVAKKKSQQN